MRTFMFAVALASFGLSGCVDKGSKPESHASSTVAPADAKPNSGHVLGLPDGWEMMPADVAQLSATQTPTDVTVKATGQFPSSNYEAKLVLSPLRIWPPQYMLARHKTGNIGTQVLTPFEVSATFKAKATLPAVIVSDEGGARPVTVLEGKD
jgi:hypothetical protein